MIIFRIFATKTYIMGKEEKKSTTIAIDADTSMTIDRYCKSKGILKKDFVRLAMNFIDQFNVDLSSQDLYLLEEAKREDEKNDIKLLPSLRKTLPVLEQFLEQMPDLINAAHTRGKEEGEAMAASARVQELTSQNNDLKGEINELHERIAKLEALISIAKSELKRCDSFFKKPSQTIIDQLQ